MGENEEETKGTRRRDKFRKEIILLKKRGMEGKSEERRKRGERERESSISSTTGKTNTFYLRCNKLCDLQNKTLSSHPLRSRRTYIKR